MNTSTLVIIALSAILLCIVLCNTEFRDNYDSLGTPLKLIEGSLTLKDTAVFGIPLSGTLLKLSNLPPDRVLRLGFGDFEMNIRSDLDGVYEFRDGVPLNLLDPKTLVKLYITYTGHEDTPRAIFSTQQVPSPFSIVLQPMLPLQSKQFVVKNGVLTVV